MAEGLDMQDFEEEKLAFTCQMGNLYPFANSYHLSLLVNVALVLWKAVHKCLPQVSSAVVTF